MIHLLWPLLRYRHATAAAAAEVRVATRDKRDAELRHAAAVRDTERARAVTADLRAEIERNGWTEMLQKAWGRR